MSRRRSSSGYTSLDDNTVRPSGSNAELQTHYQEVSAKISDFQWKVKKGKKKGAKMDALKKEIEMVFFACPRCILFQI